MVVKLFLLLLVGTYVAYSFQNVTLELNLLDNPAAYSKELVFSNSRVFTHNVNPNYLVEKVTQSGLTVWKSHKNGNKVTNATLVFNDLGPRFVYLTVYTSDNQSLLLYYLYTLYGWANLNDIHPINIVLDTNNIDNKKHNLSLNKDKVLPIEDEKEKPKLDKLEPVDLNIQMGPDNKFDYRFTYNESKYTYYYKPKLGYYVKTVFDGDTAIWKVRQGQVFSYLDVVKMNGKFVTATVTYIENGNLYVDLFTNSESGWEFTSTTQPVPPVTQLPTKFTSKDAHDLSDAMKPIDRLTVLDISNLPEPPTCRKVSFDLHGVVYNVLYVNSDSNVRKVVDGPTVIYEFPPNLKFHHACYYTNKGNTVFVDFMIRESDKIEFMYFEKDGDNYKLIPKAEFKEKLNKLFEYPAVIDISDQKEGYNVVTHVKGDFEYNIYTPLEGFVVKKVVDGNQYIIVYETDIKVLQVTTHYFKQQKSLMLLIYKNGPNFNYEYFSYSKDMGKWLRIEHHTYYNLLKQYVDEVAQKLPSLDITNTNKKLNGVQMLKYADYHVYITEPTVALSSVLDSGNMIWTARYPNEYCTYIWYQYNHNLLYLISKDDSKVRSYRYEKSGDKWYILNEEEFKLRFNFIYSKLLVANIRDDVSEQFFDVTENDNIFTIKPKSGYLIGRIRYGDRAIWVGSDNLKCTSFNLIYGWHDTYLFLEVMNSEYNKHIKYFKTINGDTFKWKSCTSFFDDYDCNEITLSSSNILNKGTFGLDVKKFMDSEKKAMELLSSPKDSVYPKVTELEKKDIDKNTDLVSFNPKDNGNEHYNTQEGNFVLNKDGDYLVVTNVDGSMEQPTPTNLYSDNTQVINGITVNPNSTLHFTPGVIDESQYPSTLDYFTVKKNKFESLGYEHRLSLTQEPHNPDKVKEFENKSNEKYYDALDNFNDKITYKNLSVLNETENKSENDDTNDIEEKDKNTTETPKLNSAVRGKLLYPKHTDPSGKSSLSNLVCKFIRSTKGKETVKHDNNDRSTSNVKNLPPTSVPVPGSKSKNNKVKRSEKKSKSLTTPEVFIYLGDNKSSTTPEDLKYPEDTKSLTTPEDFIYPEDTKSLTTPDDFIYPEDTKSLTTPEDFIYPEDTKSLTTPDDFIYPEDTKSLTTPDDFIYPEDTKSLTTPDDFIYPEDTKSLTTPEDFIYPEDTKSLTTPDDFIYPEDTKSLTTPEDFIYPEDTKSLTTPEDFIYPEDTKLQSKNKKSLTTPEDFIYPEDTKLQSKNKKSLTTPEDFVYPDDSKSESSDLFISKSEQKSSKSSTKLDDLNKSNSEGEKSSPSLTQFDKTNLTKVHPFVGFGNGNKSYLNGLLYLQDLNTTNFGEYRDARPLGFNFVLFTPYPGLPIKELRDGFETIWTSYTDECLALSVFLNNGLPKMLELFVKCSSQVHRKYYELDGENWLEVNAQRYDSVTV